MLTQDDNDILCRVGPGTPMGDLLRRYWLPALLSSEVPLPDSPPLRVRLMSEDLIAFRDTNGDVGLVANACPHRGASLFFGRNEEAGLRCVYHGWKFDTTGACVDMPSEPAESNFKTKVRVRAYPTHESGGIVWTYMGPPEKQTAFRDLGSESLAPEQWRASKVLSYCNWIQGLEGNIDTTHISFLHGGRTPYNPSEFPEGDDTDRPGYPSLAMRGYIHRTVGDPYLEVEDTWYGFRYAGIRNTPAGYVNVRVSDFIMPLFTYVPQPYLPVGGDSCIMMVPRDDDTYWRYGIDMKPDIRNAQMDSNRYDVPSFGPGTRNTGLGGGEQKRNQWSDNDYLIDREEQRKSTYSGIQGIAQQDMAVTESMGIVMDRTNEHLGTSDKAIIRMRRMLIQAAKDLAAGIEPLGLDPALPYTSIRSAERNIAVEDDWRKLGTDADPMVQDLTQIAQ
ncbi:MAG TPA: Rieske 2Fe-2S domain-containing protein [Dehalococcoidia bacterium]|nr:Rieske 2Fe-2S domain-containing protein [Dehalococcoidia bacterium]